MVKKGDFMLNIGAHLSASKGFSHMAKEALSLNANTFQFFTRNPRGGAAKALDMNDIASFIKTAKENHFSPILAHASYTLNLCSDKPDIRLFAIDTMIDDINRMEHIPNQLYNFHPGSHVGQGVDIGIDFIVHALNQAITPSQTTTVLLETMSGKGSEIGRSFDEIQRIMDKVKHNDKMGVCLDTCHVYSAGYDIVNKLDDVLSDFDKKIGLSNLKAIHLNDSLMPFNSNKDRHAKIGEGVIGLDAITRFINHDALKHLPFYLETPNELPGYKAEIALLKSVYR